MNHHRPERPRFQAPLSRDSINPVAIAAAVALPLACDFMIIAPAWLVALLAILAFLTLAPDLRHLLDNLLRTLRRVKWGPVEFLWTGDPGWTCERRR